MVKLFERYYPVRRLLFFFGETIFILLIISWVFLWKVDGDVSRLNDPSVWLRILFLLLVCQLSLYYFDLYRFKPGDNLFETSVRICQALGVASIVVGLSYIAFPQLILVKGTFLASLVFFIIAAVSWRLVYLWAIKNDFLNEKVVLLGSGQLAAEIMKEIRNNPDCGYKVVAVVANPNLESVTNNRDFLGLPIYSLEDDLLECVVRSGAEEIVVALDERRGRMPVEALLRCRMAGIPVIEGETFYELLTGKILVEKINPSWLIFGEGFRQSLFRRVVKRTVSIVCSFIGLILTLPLIVIVALAIKLDSPGPVLFVQDRVGKDGRVFRLYKFRSMRQDAEKDGAKWAAKDDPRVTRVGRIIRKLRIDEIPQMWNVLKGDMAFVGPRPERPVFVERLRKKIPFYDQRHTVHPGITGWAQICYPYGASDEDALEKLKYDLYYIKHMSLALDLYIIFKTIKIVLFGEGAR
ncbi:TIGR03013 family XrtA/PEP-CTERM system glycosyltransferase [Thermosulfuriphilus sp.]